MCGSIDNYYRMTPAQMQVAIRGHYRAIELTEQRNWERTRWVGYITLLPHRKKNHRMTVADILPFPWEAETKKQINQSDVQAMLKRIAKRDGIDIKATINGTQFSGS